MKIVPLNILPDDSQSVRDGWQLARQRDFSGGENLALQPELVKRNQLIRMENVIISPEGEITDCWQMDTPLFTNVSTGIVIAPIIGSKLFRVYAASGNNIITFIADTNAATPYDLTAASGYAGYASLAEGAPVTIRGFTHGTPFLGKTYCIASASLYVTDGSLTATPLPLAFSTVTIPASKTLSVTITNTTGSAITLTGASFSGTDAPLFGQSGSYPHTIAASGTYNIPVTYLPGYNGANTASLDISTTIGIFQVALTGTGTGMITCPSSHAYGNVYGNYIDHSFPVTNNGDRDAHITAVNFSGTDAAMFSCVTPPVITIPAHSTVNVALRFTPTSAGAKSATVSFVTDYGTVASSLTGTAVSIVRAGNFFEPRTPPYIDCGSEPVGSTKNVTFIMWNQSNWPVTVTAISITGTNSGDFSNPPYVPVPIDPNQQITMTMYFTPHATGARSATFNLTYDDSSSSNVFGTGI